MQEINTALKRHVFVIMIFGWFLNIIPLSVSPIDACVICVPYPDRTLADRLLQQHEVAYVREMPDSPYMFYQVEVLKGSGISQPINLFCSSATRRKLQVMPDSVAVVAKSNEDEKWQFITFADGEYKSFIRSIVANGEAWKNSPMSPARLQYFSRLLSSEHPLIQEQAYLEVGRAPYKMIKNAAGAIPREQIYSFLGDFRFVEWHSLYILLLGQSGNPDDHVYIRNNVESAARFGTVLNLSAWLTAFVETHPETGVEEIEKMYFENPARSEDELRQVLTCLSVLGSQNISIHTEVLSHRGKIVRSYGSLLKNYPAMAGIVANHLVNWRVKAHVVQLSAIQKDAMILDHSEKFLVDYYLSVADSFLGVDFLE